MSARAELEARTTITSTLAEAVKLIRDEAAGNTILLVGIEECDSCAALKADAFEIVDGMAVSRMIVATLVLDNTNEHPVMQELKLTDVPATYLFENGKPKGGWFGYDFDKKQEFRVAALRSAIARRMSDA